MISQLSLITLQIGLQRKIIKRNVIKQWSKLSTKVNN